MAEGVALNCLSQNFKEIKKALQLFEDSSFPEIERKLLWEVAGKFYILNSKSIVVNAAYSCGNDKLRLALLKAVVENDFSTRNYGMYIKSVRRVIITHYNKGFIEEADVLIRHFINSNGRSIPHDFDLKSLSQEAAISLIKSLVCKGERKSALLSFL